MAKEGDALGVSGFTLGIASLVLIVLSPIAGIISSVVGFLFCVMLPRGGDSCCSRGNKPGAPDRA